MNTSPDTLDARNGEARRIHPLFKISSGTAATKLTWMSNFIKQAPLTLTLIKTALFASPAQNWGHLIAARTCRLAIWARETRCSWPTSVSPIK